MFCSECGYPLNDNQRFCPKCGAPVEGVGQPADMGIGAEGSGQPMNMNIGMGTEGTAGNAAGQQGTAGYQVPPTGNAAGYQAPPTGGAQGYGVPPMGGAAYGMPNGPARGTVTKKTDRSIWIYILLSLVTCGIYPYFFIHKLAEDVNDICEGDGESTSGILTFILLGFITCGIYRIVWWYKLANRLQANGPRYNVPIQENGTTYVMWVLFGSLLCFIGPFIALNFVIKNTNKLCAVYNQYNGLA